MFYTLLISIISIVIDHLFSECVSKYLYGFSNSVLFSSVPGLCFVS